TTNSAESFHRTYNSQFYTSNPAIYVVIKILIETQAETLLKKATIEQEYVGLRYPAITDI
ncbi:Uncharacterized protein FWK35_00007363, partial [Aphis craccivora]